MDETECMDVIKTQNFLYFLLKIYILRQIEDKVDPVLN
jgi:hypothetical protein